MFRVFILSLFVCVTLMFVSFTTYAQENENVASQTQEMSEADGIPVLVKHLPDWKNKQKEAVFIVNKGALSNALGNRSIFSEIDFIDGTEAVTANYPQGKLLIVEYTTPQASTDTDKKVTEKLSQTGETVFYRRIGNYNVFLFDGNDETAANALFDRIKYQKTVQWLGTNPNLYKQAERVIVGTLSGVFVSTVLAIGLGIVFSIVVGFFVGLLYYRYTDKRRHKWEAYSDAGGMTRLNLDQLTPDVISEKLLKD
ncbi:MAG: hypothetical protein ACR2J3_12810 [Aridibacter sp.]